MAEHGLRNSLLVAPMPTASTAQILGNNESVEPFTRFVFVAEGVDWRRGGGRWVSVADFFCEVVVFCDVLCFFCYNYCAAAALSLLLLYQVWYI